MDPATDRPCPDGFRSIVCPRICKGRASAGRCETRGSTVRAEAGDLQDASRRDTSVRGRACCGRSSRYRPTIMKRNRPGPLARERWSSTSGYGSHRKSRWMRIKLLISKTNDTAPIEPIAIRACDSSGQRRIRIGLCISHDRPDAQVRISEFRSFASHVLRRFIPHPDSARRRLCL